MEGSKYDWLEYASYDTTHIELFVTPKKDVINQTIMTFLNEIWSTKWENLRGHAQTKYWCMGPDPILSAKLLNMPREHLGWCIQFFTGHGWWKKHLKLAKLCNDHTCRLCKRYNSVESPIHLFSECTELTAIRQELFNTPYPTNQSISNQLCQVAEFALVGRVCDLINIDNNPFNVNSSRWALLLRLKRGSYGFFGTCPCILCGSIPCSPHRIQTLKTKQTFSLSLILIFS